MSGLNLDKVDWIKEDATSQEITHIIDQLSWEIFIQNVDEKPRDNIQAKEK